MRRLRVKAVNSNKMQIRASPWKLREVHATIHVQRRTGDISGAVTTQIFHGFGNVLRASEASSGDHFNEFCALRLGQGLGHVGVDEARRDEIHGDVSRTEFSRERFVAEVRRAMSGRRVMA